MINNKFTVYIKRNKHLFRFLKHLVLYFRYLMSYVYHSLDYRQLKSILKESYCIQKNGYHCWFGYYDKSPMNQSNNFIAYLRIRIGATPDEVAEVCIYDIKRNQTKVIGKTTTWNWQQGCMMQWLSQNIVSFNSYDKRKTEYITKTVDIETFQENDYPRAAYAYKNDNTSFLSLNFYRLNLYAKGYGYSYAVDSLNPHEDGIWETNIKQKKAELILSLDKVIAYNKHYDDDCMHYINHVCYCSDENLILFIHRWQKKGTNFSSRLLLFDRITGKLEILLDNGHVSHYCWKSKDELLIYATNDQWQKGYMIVNLRTKNTQLIDNMPKEDGHPSYSNDKKWILTDTYPNYHRNQYLFLFDNTKNELFMIDKLFSPIKYFNDERCDLHPRWNFDCSQVLIDNTQRGYRTIKVYQIK